jgi:rubrerythrin
MPRYNLVRSEAASPGTAFGDVPRIELRCAVCGYGVIVRTAPETCPMCHGSVWNYATPRPAVAES